MSDSDGGFIKIGAFMIITGVTLIYKFIKGYKIRSYSRELPTSKVRSAAVGPIELKGNVIPSQKTVISKFSKEKCVYSALIIQQKVQTKNSSYWKTIKQYIDSEYFFIKDDTGHMLVDAKGSEIDINKGGYVYSYVKGDRRAVFDNICAENNIKVKAFIGRRSLRMQEINILADAKNVYLLGYAGKSIFKKEGDNQNLMVQYKKDVPYIISTQGEKAVQKKFGSDWTLIGGILLIVGGIGFVILQFVFW